MIDTTLDFTLAILLSASIVAVLVAGIDYKYATYSFNTVTVLSKEYNSMMSSFTITVWENHKRKVKYHISYYEYFSINRNDTINIKNLVGCITGEVYETKILTKLK